MKLNVTNNIRPRIGLAGLVLRKHSPEIMLAGGIGGGIAAAILLAKAHNKSENRLTYIFDEIEALKEAMAEANDLYDQIEADPKATRPDDVEYYAKKEQFRVLLPSYLTLGKELVMLYGPAILIGTTSIALIVGGHGILRRRNQALLSSFVLVERAFNAYRERVREELGQDSDDRFYYGLQKRTKTIVTTKDGKKKRTKEEENVLPEKLSPKMYQRVFDRTNVENWKESPGNNYFFLGMVQQMAQDTLESRGYIFLNDVYEALGFAKTPEGQVVGWCLAAPFGDKFIDFGIDKPWNDNRPDGSILLDFNVNGPVFEYIGAETPFDIDFDISE